MNLKEEKRKRRIKRKADQKKRIVKRTLKDESYPAKRQASKFLLKMIMFDAWKKMFYGKSEDKEGSSEGARQGDVIASEGEGRKVRNVRNSREFTERPPV